jgi:hypothetical protein
MDLKWGEGAITRRTMQSSNSKDIVKPRRRTSLVVVLAAALLAGWTASVSAETDADREYKVKAAFILNFVKFVDGGRLGPVAVAGDNQTATDPNGPISVGVLGRPPSTTAFAELEGKEVKDRPVVVHTFKGFDDLKDKDGRIPDHHPDIEAIRKCHVLFICPDEKAYIPQILADVRNNGVLVIADVPRFLDVGGIINFVIVENKVRFEINQAAAARAKLQIRSSLLRLAIRVVEHDELEGRNGDGS